MLMFIQHVVNDLERHASELPLFKVQEVPATVFTFLAIKYLRSRKLKLKFKRGKRKIELSYDSSQSLAQVFLQFFLTLSSLHFCAILKQNLPLSAHGRGLGFPKRNKIPLKLYYMYFSYICK